MSNSTPSKIQVDEPVKYSSVEYLIDSNIDENIIEMLEDIEKCAEETTKVPEDSKKCDEEITKVLNENQRGRSDKLKASSSKAQVSQNGTHLNRYDSDKFPCTVCSHTFVKKDQLDLHIKQSHTSQNGTKANVDLGIQCNYCPRLFKRNNTFHRHLQSFHIDKKEEWQAAVEANEQKRHHYKQGLCPYCGISYPESSLIVHMRRHTGETPYKCDECDKGFPRRQDLQVHKRKHTGERPYECVSCCLGFITENKLVTHVRVHTGQRPYKCDLCHKSFSQSNDLKIHHRRHTGERPYVCNVCNQGYISSSLLASHRRGKKHFKTEPSTLATDDGHVNVRGHKRKAEEMSEFNNEEDHIETIDFDDGGYIESIQIEFVHEDPDKK